MDDGYEPSDPKSGGYYERMADAADHRRKADRENGITHTAPPSGFGENYPGEVKADLPRCFMGYDPAEGYEDEKFYVMNMREGTIYGHTVDHWTQRDYPEDWPYTLAGRRAGREFACWHSVMCPDGEIGSNPIDAIRPISFSAFVFAMNERWPQQTSAPLTTLAPMSAVGEIDPESGKIVWVWDSLRGDLPTDSRYVGCSGCSNPYCDDCGRGCD